MSASVPNQIPRLSASDLLRLIRTNGGDLTRDPLIIVGIRGYYANTLGVPRLNDRDIYDDAIFVHSPSATAAYNANTDPSRYRKGVGRSKTTRGMPSLKPGLWPSYSFDLHGKSRYFAVCQRRGPVTTIRDGDPPYEDPETFGINIHRGGYNTTSSLGCQTIHPAQWASFIALMSDQARRLYGASWKAAPLTYLLVEQAFE